MLLRNGTVLNQYPLRQLGGGVHADITMFNRNERRNIYSGITDQKSGIPNGHVAPSSWLLPLKPGGMSSINYAVMRFTPTAAGLLGFPILADATLSISTDGTATLITSGEGAAAFTLASNTPLLTASLSGEASAAISMGGDGLLDGHAEMIATATLAMQGALAAYATGAMAGSTIDGGILTVDTILAAMNSNPPKVNIAKVNDVTVTGTGAPGSEWGP